MWKLGWKKTVANFQKMYSGTSNTFKQIVETSLDFVICLYNLHFVVACYGYECFLMF